MNPSGISLDLHSKEWCDPTKDAGYFLPKQPTLGNKESKTISIEDLTIHCLIIFQDMNSSEQEQCLTYNFGGQGANYLCLADDYCSQKYPFICEMNADSMKLASSTHYGKLKTVHIHLEMVFR